jgi:hypothetical protein
MPGLAPGIHVLCAAGKGEDGRDEHGHDAVDASVRPTLTSYAIALPPHGRLKNSTQFGFLPVE